MGATSWTLPPPQLSGSGLRSPFSQSMPALVCVCLRTGVCMQFPACQVDFFSLSRCCCNYSVYNQLFVSWFHNACLLVYRRSTERAWGQKREMRVTDTACVRACVTVAIPGHFCEKLWVFFFFSLNLFQMPPWHMKPFFPANLWQKPKAGRFRA